MSDAAPEDEMSTAALTAELTSLRQRMEEQAKDRHKLNNAMGVTLLGLGNQMLSTEAAVTKLSGEVMTVGTAVKELSARLLGNPAMQTRGLVSDVEKLSDDVNSLKKDRARMVTIVTTISGIGAVISWVSTHWPFGGGPKP